MSSFNPDKKWAKRFSRLLEEAGMTPAALADDLDVARATAYSWRSGTRIPRRDIQPRIAKRFGISVAELNGWPT